MKIDGLKKLHSSLGNGHPRSRRFSRPRLAALVTMVMLVAGIPAGTSLTVQAAPAASPACATGYGNAGTGGNGQASTAGGNGCVVIEYVVGGVTYFETFNYEGIVQSWVVPAGVETAKFMTYGAGGGGTNTLPKRTSGFDNDRLAVTDANSVSWYSGNANEGLLPDAHNGGAGGSATGTFVVTPGETLSVTVGQAGIGNSDDRCLPVVTRPDAANGSSADLTRRDAAGNINLWPINGVPANADPNVRQGFGGGGRASAFHNTRAYFPMRTTNDLGRDHDECINPYYAAGGGRSEVRRGTTRLVAAGGGGGAGFYGAGGVGATLASGNASATGGDGAGTHVVTNHPTPITVSPTYGSGGTGTAGGAGGLTSEPLDNYTGSAQANNLFTPFTLFRSHGVAGGAGNGGQAPQGGGGGGGGCFGGGGGGDGGGGGGGSSCLIGSSVLNFTTTSSDGTYVAGDSINITANMTKPIADGAQITVTLDTGETVLLTKTGPYTMSGTYVVGAGATTGDLTVSSYTLTTPPVDADGITMTSTTVPSGTNNIAGAHGIVIGLSSSPGAPSASPASFAVANIANGQGATSGGNTMTIVGTGFVAGATVTIGGKPCTSVVVSSTSITCVVPEGTLGAVDIVVVNGDQQVQTLTGAYIYVASAASGPTKPNTNGASGSQSLPSTGSESWVLLVLGAWLTGLGLTFVSRRRRCA
jgi:LPXTG-motif cell wall-anchored protein